MAAILVCCDGAAPASFLSRPSRAAFTSQQARRFSLGVVLQGDQRDQLIGELVQLREPACHIVYEDHCIFKRRGLIRGHSGSKKLPPQQGRQPPRFHREPQVSAQQTNGAVPVEPQIGIAEGKMDEIPASDSTERK
jgi:hypothetical protein